MKQNLLIEFRDLLKSQEKQKALNIIQRHKESIVRVYKNNKSFTSRRIKEDFSLGEFCVLSRQNGLAFSLVELSG